MRLVTYRRRTASGGTGSIGALSDGGLLDLGAVAGSMLELLVTAASTRRAGRSTGGGPCSPSTRWSCCAPLPRPNTIRDFMLVEEHVKNSLRRRARGVVRDPRLLEGQPGHGRRPRGRGRRGRTTRPSSTSSSRSARSSAAACGRRASRRRERAIAGYTIFNDWSARDIQFREMEVSLGPGLGKDFASSIGPCLTTPDEFDIATARDGGARQRRDLVRGRRSDRCSSRFPRGHRAPVPGAAAPARRPPRQRHRRPRLRSRARPLDRAGRRRRARGAGHRRPAQPPSAHGRRSCPQNPSSERSTHA